MVSSFDVGFDVCGLAMLLVLEMVTYITDTEGNYNPRLVLIINIYTGNSKFFSGGCSKISTLKPSAHLTWSKISVVNASISFYFTGPHATKQNKCEIK